MKIELKENERIDDLELKNLKIIQNKNGFCFGIDSVLLSDFAKQIKQGSKIADLGTGTGILPILLSAKTINTKIVGVEIQEEVANMAIRSVELNNLQNQIEIICENIKNLKNKYDQGTFDAIITNPPYKRKGTGKINVAEAKIISRHEITATLHDFIETAKYLLKDQGELYLVHRPERLVDLMAELRSKKLEPKILRFVQPSAEKAPNLVLIKAVKNAKPFLSVAEPLIVYEQNGNYSKEILKIYQKEN